VDCEPQKHLPSYDHVKHWAQVVAWDYVENWSPSAVRDGRTTGVQNGPEAIGNIQEGCGCGGG